MVIFNRRLLVWVILGSLCLGQLAHGQQRGLRPRQLAPGVITTIQDATVDDDTMDGPREFSELLSVANPQSWKPNFDPATQTLLEKAKSATFQNEIWSLEIGFKSLRIIQVDGRDIWYLIYFVRNNGDVRSPQLQADKTYALQTVNRPLRFLPTFIFQSHGLKKAYYDRTLPRAVRAIAAKERVPGRLYNSSSISGVEIPVSTASQDRPVWGVATWDNVDPATDFVSIYVQGLTNAYRWQPPTNGYQPIRQGGGTSGTGPSPEQNPAAELLAAGAMPLGYTNKKSATAFRCTRPSRNDSRRCSTFTGWKSPSNIGGSSVDVHTSGAPVAGARPSVTQTARCGPIRKSDLVFGQSPAQPPAKSAHKGLSLPVVPNPPG